MPNPKNAYKRVLSGCTRGCSLNAENLPAGLPELIHRWFEEGCNNAEIIARAAPMGSKLSNGAVGRHRSTHLHAAASIGAAIEDGEEPPKQSDLDVVDALIQQGARQVGTAAFKVTAEQLLRAIELKHRLTEGSVFDAMYDAMMSDPDDDLSDLEGDAAIRSAEERDQEGLPDGRVEGR